MSAAFPNTFPNTVDADDSVSFVAFVGRLPCVGGTLIERSVMLNRLVNAARKIEAIETGACERCLGTKLVTIEKDGIDYDDQPCPECQPQEAA